MPTRNWRLGLWALFVFTGVSCSSNQHPAADVPAHPVAVFPERVNLGQRERGEIATAKFTVATFRCNSEKYTSTWLSQLA
jgi:hypothetical protein